MPPAAAAAAASSPAREIDPRVTGPDDARRRQCRHPTPAHRLLRRTTEFDQFAENPQFDCA